MTNTQTQQPELLAHTGNRMAELAADSAKNLAIRRFQSLAKSYLPKMLWPLIPGVGGSVADNAKAGVSKWFWGIVTSVVFSLVFFAIFGVAVMGFLGLTAFAIFTS